MTKKKDETNAARMWNDVTAVRAALGGAKEDALRDAFDREDAAHLRTLCALTTDEIAGLLVRQKRPTYMGGHLARALAALAHDWMRDRGRARDALALYDALLSFEHNQKEVYANALWAVQDTNTGLGRDPERARRYVAACVKHGPSNPAIFYNAACVLAELGDVEASLANVRAAIASGYDDRDLMRRELANDPVFASVRGDRRFFDALDDKGPQGVDLVHQVIAQVRERGWSALDVPVKAKPRKRDWPGHAHDFRPLDPSVLDRLTLPDGRPLPPSLATWLAFDAGWLEQQGWFTTSPSFAWTPRTLGQLACDEYGGALDDTSELPDWAEIDDDDDPNWGREFDVPRFTHTFLLPGGSDSRRVFALTAAPDALGEYPVLWTDVDDLPSLGVMYPGFDVWLASEANVVTVNGETYGAAFDDFRYRGRCLHHARVAFDGELEVQLPARDPMEPLHQRRAAGEPMMLLGEEGWFDDLLALRATLPAPAQREARITGASPAEIQALEARLGASLPEAVARFYRKVNGLDWRDLRFFSIAEILDERHQAQLRKAMNAAAAADDDADGDDDGQAREDAGEIEEGHFFFCASRERDLGAVLGVCEGASYVATVQLGSVRFASPTQTITLLIDGLLGGEDEDEDEDEDA